jgi:tetratricopeptide (TPR) repeat protein
MNLFHWNIQRTVERYLDHTLPQRKRHDFENHLGDCSGCQGKFQVEKSFLDKLISAGRTIGPSEASWERTHARILALPRHKSPYPQTDTSDNVSFLWLKNWKMAGVAIASLAILILTYIFWTSAAIPVMTPLKMAGLVGEGIYRQSEQGGTWEKISSKTPLQIGDRIQTDEYTRTALKLGNIGQVWVNRSSQFALLQNATVALTIESGQIDVKVNRHVDNFQVQTPAGMVHVYGTEFQLAVDSHQNTVVSCIQHTVYFENAFGKVTITAGYQSFANPQKAPSSPIAVDTANLLNWKTQLNQLNNLSNNQRKASFQTWILDGDNHYSIEKYPEALDDYKTAVSLDPAKDNGYYGIARVYQTLGDFAMATTEYLHGIEKNPSNGLLVYQLAQCLLELKQYDMAEKYLIQLINTSEPNYVDVWASLGDTYLLEGEFDKAQEIYNQALRKGAQNFDNSAAHVYGGLAEIERHNQNYPKALEYINKAFHCKAIPSIVYLEAARLYRDANDKNNEIASWKYYLQTDPKGAFAREAQNRLKVLEFVPMAKNSSN